ncbi:glycogen debranching N-terminal domain-containing protein [Rugosimonospora acidiphila]|uniref:Glycogen debranching N-terminal domain-containing protein n=1 Tax=Rugosimonospora acidiphila TaxID=556531 RepID=A0ABP9SEP1_9ACTN
MAQPPRQRSLHDLVATTHAPTTVLGGPDGQIGGPGAQGVYHADLRALSTVELLLDGRRPEPVLAALDGPHGARFVSLAGHLGDEGRDPTVRVERVRLAVPDGMTEEVVVRSTAGAPVTTTVTVRAGCDLAPMREVKRGGRGTPRPAEPMAGGLRWAGEDTEVVLSGDGATALPDGLEWTLTVPPGGAATLRFRVRVKTSAAAVAVAGAPVEWSSPRLVADDRRLVRLVDRSLYDLAALRLTEPDHPDDTFLGAGVPWYLTLFGRDSLWAARMMLPLGTRLAAGTLRALARRQGRAVDERSGEAPGKVMHELRHGSVFAGTQARPGSVAYYGTVDATPLWIVLLHEAWCWGMPDDEVAALLPNLEAALGWLAACGAEGGGFLTYRGHPGHGLVNQGWKDSVEALRRSDGRQAEAPIALCEVQGYAYQAALAGARMLDAFGRPGSARWRGYADELGERFRARFWVDGPDGPYPALALDGGGRPVDVLTSNIGHLLGTGLLTGDESARVAARLTAPELAGGFGLRTLSAREPGFHPLSYHCGSIWAHDTAIVIDGLARAGFGAAAAGLAGGLLAAAEAFDYRLPELYGGDDRADFGRPVPYPASCRPQAWSAAAAVLVLRAALGLEPDVPAGELRLRPLPGAPLGAVVAAGLRVGRHEVEVSLDGTGAVSVGGLPAGLRVVRRADDPAAGPVVDPAAGPVVDPAAGPVVDPAAGIGAGAVPVSS